MDRPGSVAWLKALSLIIVLGTGLAAQADDWLYLRDQDLLFCYDIRANER
jgi:hypothetical protein